MKLTIENDNLVQLQTYLSLLSGISFETSMKFTDDGILMEANQGGNIATKLILKKEFFKEYEGEGTYGVFISEISKVIKTIKTKLTITDEGDKINIIADKFKFKSPILEDLEKKQKLPELEFGTPIKITMIQVADIISKLKLVKSSQIKLQVKDKKLNVLVSTGKEDSGTGREMNFEVGDADMEDCHINIQTSYFEKLNIKSNDNLLLYIKNEYPFIAKIEKEDSELTYVVAPLIE